METRIAARPSEAMTRQQSKGSWYGTATGVFAIGLVVAGCAGQQAPTSAVTSPAVTVTAATAILPVETPPTDATTDLSIAVALARVLADDFTAKANIRGSLEQGDVVITVQGSGVVSGPDSEVSLEYDFSLLPEPTLRPDGRVIGPGGSAIYVEASRYVDGRLLKSIEGGPWTLVGAGAAQTFLGHIFDRLGEVGSFVDKGSVNVDGLELHRLQPAETIEYEPGYFDAPESLRLPATADIYVDGAGIPQRIETTIAVESGGAPVAAWVYTIDLTSVGHSVRIARHTPWIPLSDLGFDVPFVALLVPETWTVVERQTEFIILRTPDEYHLAVEASMLGAVGASGAMAGWTRAFDAESYDEEPWDEGAVSAVIATVDFPGRAGLAYTSNVGELVVALMWLSPNQDVQRGRFEEVLTTLEWVNPNPNNLIPGNPMGDVEVQRDVLALLLPIAADDDCADPQPVFAEQVSGDEGGWSEDWFLDACGTLKAARVTFSFEPDGTGFSFQPPEPVSERDSVGD